MTVGPNGGEKENQLGAQEKEPLKAHWENAEQIEGDARGCSEVGSDLEVQAGSAAETGRAVRIS